VPTTSGSDAGSSAGWARAILWGGLAAGALDITAAFVVYGLRGATPLRILQSIASGLNFVVLPLSAVPKRPFVLGMALLILVVHMVFVGLPISLAVRRWAPLRPPAGAAP